MNLPGCTLQGNIPQKWHFEDDFPIPKVGYVNSLEGNLLQVLDSYGLYHSKSSILKRPRLVERISWKISSHLWTVEQNQVISIILFK